MSQKAKTVGDSDLNYTPTEYDYAAIYARRSSVKDSKSIETQIKLAKKLALEKGLIIYDIYQEEVSATDRFEENRPEFNRLIEDAKLGNRFKSVLCFRRDRLTRNIYDGLLIRNVFLTQDIKVYFTDTTEYISDGSPFSIFIENIIIGMGALEADAIKGRIEPGRLNKRKNGEYTTPRTLFIHNKIKFKSKSEYKLKDENVSTLVTKLFKAYIKAGNRDENTDKIFTKIKEKYWDSSKSKSKKNKNGYDNCIQFMKAPVLAGIQTIEGSDKVDDTFFFNKDAGLFEIKEEMYQNCTNTDVAVHKDIWFEAMNIWRNNYTPQYRPSVNYLFKGVIFCHHCGTEIRLISNTYICKKNCSFFTSEELFPPLLKKVIDDLFTSSNINDYIKHKIEELIESRKSIDNEMRSNKSDQHAEIQYIIDNNLNIKDSESLKELTQKYTSLSVEKSNISASINKLCDSESVIKKLMESKELAIEILLNDKNIEYAQKLLTSIIEKVVIIDSETRNFHYKFK